MTFLQRVHISLCPPKVKPGVAAFESTIMIDVASLWNGIPLEIRQSNSVSVFKKNLKTHLSKQAF